MAAVAVVEVPVLTTAEPSRGEAVFTPSIAYTATSTSLATEDVIVKVEDAKAEVKTAYHTSVTILSPYSEPALVNVTPEREGVRVIELPVDQAEAATIRMSGTAEVDMVQLPLVVVKVKLQ